MQSDEALHERLLRGDLAAFDQLYARHATVLHAYVRRHLADAHEAEDVLHEAFLALLRQREGAQAAANLRAWLFTVARNLCLNRLRSLRRGARALESAAPLEPEPLEPERLFEARQSAERLERAVAKLPPGLAELYALRAGGLSYEELAVALAIPVGTVKSRLHDLVGRLRQEVDR